MDSRRSILLDSWLRRRLCCLNPLLNLNSTWLCDVSMVLSSAMLLCMLKGLQAHLAWILFVVYLFHSASGDLFSSACVDDVDPSGVSVFVACRLGIFLVWYLCHNPYMYIWL